MANVFPSVAIASIVATAIALPIEPAAAGKLTWILDDGVFDDGGTATGSFDYAQATSTR